MTDTIGGAEATGQGTFRIGDVLISTINIYSRNALIFTLVSGIFWFPAVLAGYYLEHGFSVAGGPVVYSDVASAAMRQWEQLLVVLFMLTLQPLGTAIVLYAAFQDMRGQPVEIGVSVARALARFPALVGLTLLMTVAVMMGFVLLVVPGIILMVMWYLAVPVCMVEKTGPVTSLDRSQRLTKGHRWKLFGLFLFVVILGAIGDSVSAGIGAALLRDAGAVLLQTVWQGISQALSSIMIVVAYYQLRVAKEGVDIDQIASVFE
jgi:hypothetical protein